MRGTLMVWACLVAFAIPSQAAIYTVKPFGDPRVADFDNLQAAIDAAQDGDELHLLTGRYQGNFSIEDKNINLIGTGESPDDVRLSDTLQINFSAVGIVNTSFGCEKVRSIVLPRYPCIGIGWSSVTFKSVAISCGEGQVPYGVNSLVYISNGADSCRRVEFDEVVLQCTKDVNNHHPLGVVHPLEVVGLQCPVVFKNSWLETGPNLLRSSGIELDRTVWWGGNLVAYHTFSLRNSIILRDREHITSGEFDYPVPFVRKPSLDFFDLETIRIENSIIIDLIGKEESFYNLNENSVGSYFVRASVVYPHSLPDGNWTTIDPQFQDISHYDVRLSSSSPLIDKGDYLGNGLDASGVPFPDFPTGLTDIGPYEYPKNGIADARILLGGGYADAQNVTLQYITNAPGDVILSSNGISLLRIPTIASQPGIEASSLFLPRAESLAPLLLEAVFSSESQAPSAAWPYLNVGE